MAAGDVASISLEDIRIGGVGRVTDILKNCHGGQPVILNVVDYPDLWTAVLGILEAEGSGKRFLYHTGASFVRARAGITARPLLTRAELLPRPLSANTRGLVVVGSHVQRTSDQLNWLLTNSATVGLEVRVPELLDSNDQREAELKRVDAEMRDAFMKDETPVVFTSREI